MNDRVIQNPTIEKYRQRSLNECLSMSVFCSSHPLISLRPLLRKQKVVTADELRRIPSNYRVRLCGIQIIRHTPPTKSGKRVMFITLEDETGLFDVVVFSRSLERYAKTIIQSEVLTIEGRLQRQGTYGKSISIIMERLIVGFCGSLIGLLGGDGVPGDVSSVTGRKKYSVD